MIDLTPLAAALVAGFLGSAHCLGMCSGISGMIAVKAGQRALSASLVLAIAYNFGRLLSYAGLGAIVAALGDAMVAAIPAIAGPVRLLGGALIVLVGLQIAFNLRLLAPLERAGLALWTRIAPAAGNLLPANTPPRALALGLLWGFIPCGLVYSLLLIAATSADPLQGAAIMFVFGLGTSPAMLATGLGALSLSRFAEHARPAAGLLVIAIGVLTIVFPLGSLLGGAEHSMHHH
ncbi:MAG: sulfite exporter TauE/SafE family protein [Pseudomonadota bacterium]